MDVQAISTALMDALAELDIRSYDYSTDEPIPPAAYIVPAELPLHASFSENAELTWRVRLFVAATNNRAGQQQLARLISVDTSGSVIDALELDNTLGNVVSGAVVRTVRDIGVLTLGSARFHAADIVVGILV